MTPALLEEPRIADLDHSDSGEIAERVAPPPAGQAGDQVGQRLAFRRGDEGLVMVIP